MHFRALICAGIAFSGFLIAAPVMADPPAAPASKAAAPNAERLFEDGMKASNAGDWSKARAAFSEAWRLKQHWKIAANLGRANFKLGRHCEAVEHLTYFLREAKDLSEADRKQAQVMLDEAKAKVGSLKVRVNVDGADVLIDGQSVGRSPLSGPVCVEAGERTAEARGNGKKYAKASAEVNPAMLSELSLELPSIAISHLAEPDAVNPGGRPVLLVVTACFSAVFVATGVAFGVGAAIKNTDTSESFDALDKIREETLSDQKLCNEISNKNTAECKTFREDLRLRDAYRTVSIVGFVVGGVAAAGTMALVLWPSDKPRQSIRSRTSIALTVNRPGLSVTGSF